MIKLDWSKAPDWATRAGLLDAGTLSGGLDNGLIWYNADQFCRMSDERQKPFPWGNRADSDDARHNPRESQVRFSESRPKAWDGEGLPPSGAACEIRSVAAGTEWAQATIVFASRNVIVWDWAGEPSINGLCTAYAHAVEMRPVRTPEQIAAEEREKAIAEMVSTSPMLDKGWARKVCTALYDAGYRKQVAPATKPERVLTDEAQADRDDFKQNGRGCACHLGCAPCSHCTHPGNPRNQDDDESCWREVAP